MPSARDERTATAILNELSYGMSRDDSDGRPLEEFHGPELIAAIAEAIAQEREACALKAGEWTRSAHLTLHAGEMTAQERRTVKAVVSAICAAIRARGAP